MASGAGDELGAQHLDLLVETLSAARSADAAQREPAEATLHDLEQTPGFLTLLLAAIHEPSERLAGPVRLLASIYFKNTVAVLWRPMAAPGVALIGDCEKAHLRANLRAFLDIPEDPVAAQMALALGKIARCDVPAFWPELLPNMVAQVQADAASGFGTQAFQRSLLALYHIVDELASRRRQPDRLMFRDSAEALVRVLAEAYAALASALAEALAAPDLAELEAHEAHGLVRLVQAARLCLATLCSALCYGVDSLASAPHGLDFLLSLADHVRLAAQALNVLGERHPLAVGCLAFIDEATDSLALVLALHPASFACLLGHYLELFCALLQEHVTAHSPGGQRCLTLALNFLIAVEECREYAPQAHAAARLSADSGAAVASAFWTAENLAGALSLLVRHVLPLSEADLAEWQAAPESFVLRQEALAFEVDAPAAAAQLISLWLKNRGDMMCALVLELLHEACAMPLASMDAVLLRDAAYVCAGLGFWVLYDALPFVDWLQNALASEARSDAPGMGILHRRIAWLVEQWTPALRAPAARELCYALLLGMLGSRDAVVALSAVTALRVLLDDVDFDTAAFAPFAKACVAALYGLWDACELADTKLRALRAISLILSAMGTAGGELALDIAATLPQLWHACQPYDELKAAMLSTTVATVRELGPRAAELYDFVLPVIAYAASPATLASAFLIDEALELWEAVLDAAIEPDAGLLGLFALLCEVTDSGLGEFRACMALMRAYVLLGGAPLLAEHGALLAASLMHVTQALTSEDALLAPAELAETCLMVAPGEAPALLADYLAGVACAVLGRRVQTQLCCRYLALLGRVCVVNGDAFGALMAQMGAAAELGGGEGALAALVDVWLERWDAIARADQRKLSAMVLVSLVARPGEALTTSHFAPVMSAAIGALCEADAAAAPRRVTPFGVGLFGESDAPALDGSPGSLLGLRASPRRPEAAAVRRRRLLYESDPVTACPLHEHIAHTLSALAGSIGAQAFDALLGRLDSFELHHLLQLLQ